MILFPTAVNGEHPTTLEESEVGQQDHASHGITYMPTYVLPPPENLPASSTHRLSRLDIQRAITDAKRFIEARLEKDLNLVRVSLSLLQVVDPMLDTNH